MRLSDLPADVQAKVRAQMGGQPKRKRPSRAEAEGPDTPYRCVRCDEVFASVDKWQRHSHASGHRRGEAVLGAPLARGNG